MMRQRLIANKAQTVVTYPPQAAVASALSALVQTPSGASALAKTPTVDSVNATVSAAADAGATALTFSVDPAAVAGRLYLLQCPAYTLTVECQKTGTTLALASPLPAPVPAGAILRGFAVLTAMTADELADNGHMFCRFEATLNGAPVVWFDTVDVDTAVAGALLTVPELQRLMPDLSLLRHPSDATLQAAIDAAVVLFLLPALAAVGIQLETVRDTRLLHPVIVAAVRHHLYLSDLSLPSERIEYAEKLRKDAFNMFMLTRPLLGSTTDMTATPTDTAAQAAEWSM